MTPMAALTGSTGGQWPWEMYVASGPRWPTETQKLRVAISSPKTPAAASEGVMMAVVGFETPAIVLLWNHTLADAW